MNRLTSTLRSVTRPLWASGLPLVLAAGCGGDAKSPAHAPSAAHAPANGAPVAAQGDAHHHDHNLPSGRVPSPKLIDRRSRSAVASDSLGVARTSARPPKTEEEVYRAVAPATVIVRVPDGLGSGVIIDPAGWVLTNHHVVEHGTTEDFKTKVGIVLGHLDKSTGGMERDTKEYTAWVYKDDKLRDLALVKIDNPPKKLPFVPLSSKLPVPGEHVIAIGHAGAGMLWAIKAGEISALGKLSEHLATLAQFKDDADGKKAEDEFKKYLDDQNLGLVIQSTCEILPGDSGGPLVTQSGELVGLNAFSNRDPRTGGLLNFHIHLSEIEKFVKDKPAKVAQLVPDAWAEGGGDASYEDVDLDGKVDTLMLQGRRACPYCPSQSVAVFIDPDEDMAGKLPDLTEVYKKKGFSGDLVYLRLEDNSYIWYDTDEDGRYDILLVDDSTTGRSSAAYRIDKDGVLTKDDALASGPVIRMSLFKDEESRERLQRIASAAFPDNYVEAGQAIAEALPDPVGATGEAQTADLDGDGAADSVRINTTFSTRVVVDVDENTAPKLPAEFDVQKALKPGVLDSEVSVVTQSTNMWVWYDTDNDGRYDLVLHAPQSRQYVATEAFHVDASGNRTEAPEDVGRKLVRPELLGSLGLRMQRIVDKGFLDILSAGDDSGLASFPDPVKDHRGTSMSILALKGSPDNVVAIHGYGSDGYLVDLDGNSLRGKNLKKVDVEKMANEGKFDAELAYFQREGLAWAYYDTDDKDGYDTVFYSANPHGGLVDRAYHVDKNGATLDPSLANGPLIRPSLFKKKAMSAKLKKLASELFSDAAVEK